MASRLELHDELVELLGSRNVYFQPPASIRLKYPCIKYKLNDISTLNADDQLYGYTLRYEIIVIDENPDSEIFEKMLVFPRTSFLRHYVSDNLNHWVFLLNY